jgi:hypothetical protein
LLDLSRIQFATNNREKGIGDSPDVDLNLEETDAPQSAGAVAH